MGLRETSIALTVKGTLFNNLDLKSVTSALNMGRSIAYAEGTGANQADKLWDDSRQIAASANDDLDLAGVLLDAFGVAITFAKVKAIIVAAAAGNTNNVVVGGAGVNGFVGPFGTNAHTVAVKPGGILAMACSDAAGWAVTPGTGDLLRVANGGAGSIVNYDIVIIGTSA